MNLEIFKSSYGYYNLRTNDGRPSQEMVDYLKQNGYRWSPKNKCWYPATTEAKNANLYDDFVVKFQEKFSDSDNTKVVQEKKSFGQELIEREERKTQWRNAHGLNENHEAEKLTVEILPNHATDYSLEKEMLEKLSNNIEDEITKEHTVKLEELIAELREQLKLQNEKITQLESSNQKLTKKLNEKENETPELKTYHTLKADDVKNLEIVTDEEFSDIVDSIILNDYKNIPNAIRLPNLNAELSEKLGLAKDSAFILKKSATHIRPTRKGDYNQALDTEEYREIPKVMREATFALVDKRFDNFQILFDDVDDIKKINKLAFNKDKLGNYLVTVGKIDRRDGISEIDNIVVGVGVAPTISALRYPEEPPATRLRPSPTTVNLNIAQSAEKSSVPVEKLNEPFSKKKFSEIRSQCREILRKPDSEITEADKAILAQYEGAGGLNEANRSVNGVLNEFYTPQNIVAKVWKIVDYYAPNAKTVLEPSAGIGKFAVNRPQNDFTMHELDETSARINKILHPEANIIQGAYQKQFFDEGERFRKTDFIQPKYDVVIGNPPYGKYSDKYKGLGEGKEFDRYEEYFISKGLDALKDENSLMAFVVPSGFLKTARDNQKKIIAQKGDLIDAYRLPEGTFDTTDVGTDIIVMRSWDKKKQKLNEKARDNAAFQKLEIQSWIAREAFNLSDDQWFKNHPEKILGKTVEYTDRFGKPATKVVPHDGLSVQDELDKIDGFFLKSIENQKSELKSSEHKASPQAQATNYVLEKLKAAGIEVVTDKEEFERILEREKFLQKMAGTLTPEEQKRYFTFNEDDTAKFKSQVDEWKKSKDENSRFNPGKLIEVGEIPPLFNALGIADNPIEVQYSTLSKMVRPLPEGYPNEAQGHALSVDDIYDIPCQLADPVMVFKSRTRDDSYVFFTERKDSQNRSILIPMAVNKHKGRIVINEITSMYGRNNEIDFVKTNIDEGNLIYADKKRSLEWERECKVQFLTQGLPSQDSIDNILTKERLVNFISANSQKRTPVQKMALASDRKQVYGFTYEAKST